MDNIFAQFGHNVASDIILQQQWDELKSAIANHNVIPVIGPNLQISPAYTPIGTTCNAQKILLTELAKWMEITNTPTSFSELLYDYSLPKDYDRRYIYAQLTQLFEGEISSIFQPHPAVIKLLETKQFPFVITTCFTPMVEMVMRQIWGERLRIRVFDNNPQTLCDIDSEEEIDTPTVFYMFGKAANTRCGSFAVTDGDMLSFCQAWLDESRRPKNLISLLQDRYLLMLGSDYSDWLCRFVLHSMKPNKRTGMFVGASQEDTLLHFLKRMDNFILDDPQKVIDELCSQIHGTELTLPIVAALNTDVFISYSRRDNSIAESLYKELTRRGFNVWFDRNTLKPGNDFMREIRRAITTTRLFVPILSQNIMAERNESHPYRVEWDVAVNYAISIGRDFIIPVAEQQFNFYDAQVSEGLRKHNAITYDSAVPDIKLIADKIQSVLQS